MTKPIDPCYPYRRGVPLSDVVLYDDGFPSVPPYLKGPDIASAANLDYLAVVRFGLNRLLQAGLLEKIPGSTPLYRKLSVAEVTNEWGHEVLAMMIPIRKALAANKK